MTRQNQFPKWTRRDFVKASGGCAALTSATFLSTVLNLKLTKTVLAAAGAQSDYKALVCVFHHGGTDAFNMLAPYEDGEYADYATIRSGLAIPQSDLLPISDSTGRRFGIHAGMPEFQSLYNAGNLAFVANVGSLIGPTTKSDYQNRTNLPLGLFSHADEQRHWQTCVPQSRTQITGWAGRMADLLTDTTNSNPTVAMNIAVGFLNILQTGDNVIPYVIHQTGGAQLLSGYQGNGLYNQILTETTDSILAQTYTDLLEKTHATRRRGSIDAAISFNNAVNSVTLNTVFPNTSLGRQLNMVARTIAAREALGQTRQIFLVERGGWDHHANLLNNQANMLPEVSQALQAFYDATIELGVSPDVTTHSISDFARTLTQNGSNGSDHAWGSNHYIMGGSVRGGHVYGDYPTSLAAGNPLDVGRGRLIPTSAVDEFAAELCLWFGLNNDSDLETVLPNIRNFYASGAGSPPLGFLA